MSDRVEDNSLIGDGQTTVPGQRPPGRPDHHSQPPHRAQGRQPSSRGEGAIGGADPQTASLSQSRPLQNRQAHVAVDCRSAGQDAA
jgi:hypothetical protein